jgi:hypothetical protein
MFNLKRTALIVGLALSIGQAATPLAVAAGDKPAHHRYYDKEHKDYHEWTEREEHAYRDYLKDQHREYRDFAKMNHKNQNAYWHWRHEHPEEFR